ncbi:MAG: phosphoenolpyruvate carboxylase [Novosphingobium sp.]
MDSVAALDRRLEELHARTAETPLFNPVFQLSLDLSRQIEDGSLDLGAVEGLVADLECRSLKVRAQHLHTLVAPVALEDNVAALRKLFDGDEDFEAFRTRWQRPSLHAVFTAHPTFLLSPAQADAVANAAAVDTPVDEQVCVLAGNEPAITLDHEHEEVIRAVASAAAARDVIVAEVLRHARDRWPDRWRELCPQPFRFATWVGYDMDGRTDIAWTTSVSYRLREKASRLAGYAAQLQAIDPAHPLLAAVSAAGTFADDRAADFAGDLTDPAKLSAAANRLTADDPAKLLTLQPVIEQLEAEAAATEDGERAIALKTVAAAMRADGLGIGWIHFRVNASQLHNAIRRRIDSDGTLDLGSKGALVRLRELLAEVKPLRSNVAALAIENATALRQFLAMVQILRHVDADAPIRMLVAECEQPQTVLAALFFARLFGIEDKVDVSPLFETEAALEHGGRFLEALFAEPAYRQYARRRGRVAIQTGFSDAGRFVGQIPAALAIERLQGRLAETMAAAGLIDVAALVFNTHGESMGRGAHPAGFADRFAWPLSPWSRGRFAKAGIALEPETSFQGGDGYLFFRAPELALATLVRVLEQSAVAPGKSVDPFYRRTDLSLDFYRGIRRIQRQHLESRTYARAVTAFGLGLLKTTGSRVSRRAGGRDMSLRQIRAIPHNAVLQQLGYPINVLTGAGTGAGSEIEAVAELLGASFRGGQIVRLLRAANGLASIKTVAAYGELFNSAYWASRPYRGTERRLEQACLTLAEYLTTDDRNGVFRRLASRLRVDWMKLNRLLALLPADPDAAGREETRRSIGLLQAVRLALLQHMFLRAAQVPPFSRSNDISREDVLEMIMSLRIDDAVGQLRRAFPVAEPQLGDFKVDEPTDYPDLPGGGYAALRARFIDPIERAHALNLRIAVAIANHFGAHG